MAALLACHASMLSAQDARARGSAGQMAMAQSQRGTVKGKVVDKSSNEPMSGAVVSLIGQGSSARSGTYSDANGEFTLTGVQPGSYKLQISFVGYGSTEQDVTVAEGQTITVGTIVLSESSILGEEIVVTASRRPEKLTEAPASISVINSRDLEQTAGFNVGELASKLQGVEFVRIGVNGVGINARGFNNAFNAKILALNDGRNGMLPGGSGLPLGLANTVIKEDVERVEVALGPSSALYGPNAHNGVVNTITKDPRIYQGTTFAISAGNQGLYSVRLRNAKKIDEHWAYKVTAEYTEGYDFNFRDSVYAGGGGAPNRVIPERLTDADFKFRHIRGEGHVYYTFNDKWTAIASYGASVNNYLAVNNVGRNRLQDQQYWFAQFRLINPRFYLQVNNSWVDFGRSFSINSYTADFYNRTNTVTPRGTIIDPVTSVPTTGLLTLPEAEAWGKRPGNSFQEYSQRLQADAQYNNTVAGFNFVVGVNYQLDNPNTFGTSLADGINPQTGSAQLVRITQFGGAVQVERKLPGNLEFIRLFAAARLDNHSVFGNLFAPKGGVVINALGGSFRATVGRAFAAPIILFQSANLLNGLAFGNGPGVRYIPNGAAANSAPISTDPLKPEDITTYEVGYKGIVAQKLYIDVSAYYGSSVNFLSPLIAVAGRAISVGSIPVSPALPGTVDVNGNIVGASFFTYFNYGRINSYGLDLGINYYMNDYVTLGLKYSWFGSDITQVRADNDANRDGYVSAEERSLNAPAQRAIISANFKNLINGKFFANIAVRMVPQFVFYSGNQIADNTGNFLPYILTNSFRGGMLRNDPSAIVDPARYNPLNLPLANNNSTVLNPGFAPNSYTQSRLFNRGPLGGFISTDVSVGYQLTKAVTLGASVSNLFDVPQLEFVGSPYIRRLYAAEIRFHFE